jgi:hypothetical protein
MMMQTILDTITHEITSWPGMSAGSHRFGGVEYTLGGTEVGHIHGNGMVDIPFNSKLRDQLIAEGLAGPHHMLKDTGWITTFVRSEADVERALKLYRLNYLFNATRRHGREAIGGQVDVSAAVNALGLSEPLQAIFAAVTGIPNPSPAD